MHTVADDQIVSATAGQSYPSKEAAAVDVFEAADFFWDIIVALLINVLCTAPGLTL